MKGVPSCGTGNFFKRPYLTAVVTNGSPAALPFRFSALDGKVNCANHKLTFKFASISEPAGGGQVDVMQKYIIHSAGANEINEGSLIPTTDLSSKCFITRGLVNLDQLAFAQMNVNRDAGMGMTTQMWHSSDTQEGIFPLSPKEMHTQIVLNGKNNVPAYNFYFIHITPFNKKTCRREHPLSFLDFDCFPFNQIFREIIIKWKSNNSAGEQLVWKYHVDPEMDVFYSFFVDYYKNFWPESKIPTKDEWLVKPVIIFSPNTRAGSPTRKFTSFNTGSITMDLTYRDNLTAADFFTIFGENYNFDFDPTLKFPAQAGAVNAEYTIGRYHAGYDITGVAHDVLAGHIKTEAAAEHLLAPNASHEIQGNAHIPLSFAALNQMLSGQVIRVTMTNTHILWFAGHGINGSVPCTVFVKSGGTGPAPSIVPKK